MSKEFGIDWDALKASNDAILAGPPPRDAWANNEGFNLVSLYDWLELCRKAAVPHVPATEIAQMSVEMLLRFEEDSPEVARCHKPFWAKIERAKKQRRTMLRWDMCTCSKVKLRLGNGHPEWHQDLLDWFLLDDPRAFDLLYEYPGQLMRVWQRPWMDAAILDDHPIEYRVFVDGGYIIGISSYYPQRPLPCTTNVMRDIRDCRVFTEKLIWHLPLPIRRLGGAGPTFPCNSKSFTADFMRLASGEIRFLEGGPPFGWGAHPCCFPEQGPWETEVALELQR